jgi:hypothetical protein
MKKQTGIWIDSTKRSLLLFKTGKKQLVKSNLILYKVYHDKEGDKGSFWGQHMDSQKSLTKENIKSIPI